ncbi:MAG: hypothetical protein CM1200mP40_30620 [Gammaproteobacteria bacterium]|nr:MAG: hypothetical protein CM1200mP40_30620 [Gammaproteobacteria bacterium]
MSNINVAVVGATGAVGEIMLEILAERDFPVNELYPLASERSAGTTVMYKNKPVTVGNLAEFDFSKAQIGLFFCWWQHFRRICPKSRRCGLYSNR